MEKISNNDICEMLNNSLGGKWSFGFDKRTNPCFHNFNPDKKSNALLPINLTWSSNKPNEEEIKKMCNEFDWAKLYEESIGIHIYEKDQWIKRKIYIHICEDRHYSILLPRRIEKLIEKRLNPPTKVDDGRGGK